MQVTFISKIVSVRPGPALRQTISNVLNGKEEGQDPPEEVEEDEEENLRRQKHASAHKKKVFQDLCDTKFDKCFNLVNTAYVIQHAQCRSCPSQARKRCQCGLECFWRQ